MKYKYFYALLSRWAFPFAVGILLLVAILSGVTIHRLIVSNEWVNHTRVVMLKLEELISLLKDAENGQREFYMTSDDQYFQPLAITQEAVEQNFNVLLTLTLDNPSQQQRLSVLQKHVKSLFSIYQEEVAFLKKGQHYDLTLIQRERAVMNDVRKKINTIEAEEDLLLSSRIRRSQEYEQGTYLLMALAFTIALVVVSITFYKNKQHLEQVRIAEKQLYDKNQSLAAALEELQSAEEHLLSLNHQLEEKVVERTNEIEQQQKELILRNQALAANEEKLQQNLEKTVNLNKYLSEQKNFLSAIIDQTPIATWITDEYGQRTHINDACLHLFGYQSLDELGAYNFLQDPNVIRASFYQRLQSVYAQGETIKFTSSYQVSPQKLCYFVNTVFPIKDEDDKVTHVVIQQEDVTNQHLYERDLAQKNAMLEKTNADLDNFIYTASHDLKAPIANIEGLTNILRAKVDTRDPMQNEIIEMIARSVIKFKTTINDLTEISKLQKNLEQTAEQISVSTLLSDLKTEMHGLFEDAKATIEENISVDTVFYSKRNFRSILYNLMSNAVKYRSPERRLHVVITTRQENDQVFLSVGDNGLGLTATQQGRVFDMFKRLHTHVDGSGIGLYIVKRMLINSDDSIEVHSQLNKGTTFRVTFNNQPVSVM